jgi:hypothetical protein
VIIPQLYEKDIVQMMSTTYFIGLLPQIMDFVETELKKQGFNPLDSDEKKITEECMKISPTCLKFCLDSDNYQTSTDNLEKINILLTSNSSRNNKKIMRQDIHCKNSVIPGIFVEIIYIKILHDAMEGLIHDNALIKLMKLLVSSKKTLVNELSHKFRKQARDMLNKSLEEE